MFYPSRGSDVLTLESHLAEIEKHVSGDSIPLAKSAFQRVFESISILLGIGQPTPLRASSRGDLATLSVLFNCEHSEPILKAITRTDDLYLSCIQNRIVDPVHFGAEQQFHW